MVLSIRRTSVGCCAGRGPPTSRAGRDHPFAFEQMANGPKAQISLTLEHPDPEEQIEKGRRVARPGPLLARAGKEALSYIIMNGARGDPGSSCHLVDGQAFGIHWL